MEESKSKLQIHQKWKNGKKEKKKGSKKRNTGAEATTSIVAGAKQEWKLTAEGQEGIRGVKEMLSELDSGDGCSALYTY